MTMVDHWRQLPFRDPGLPPDLLPVGWTGREALALFERRVTQLEDRALSHAAACWPAHR